MKQITINLPDKQPAAYTLSVGAGALEKISELYDLEQYSRLLVVTDESLKPLLEKLLAVLPGKTANVILPAGEQHKHVNTVQQIWTALHQAGCDRKSLVVNLGGGVVGDIGGFAASTYMRGIDFLNIPTTLLAQVDASVGGKTGFNFDGIKNLIGTFNQPVGVVIDPETLAGLPQRELIAGFAEIIKHGLIADTAYVQQVTAKPPADYTTEELADIIARSCQIKADIVQADETESGQRKLLNFGHTVGHAVEALSHDSETPLLHGEAVSIGMTVEADISVRLGLLPAAEAVSVKDLLQKAGLPTAVPSNLSPDAILTKLHSDKKNEAGKLNFTLLQAIGQAVYNQHVDKTLVREALQSATGENS